MAALTAGVVMITALGGEPDVCHPIGGEHPTNNGHGDGIVVPAVARDENTAWDGKKVCWGNEGENAWQ